MKRLFIKIFIVLSILYVVGFFFQRYCDNFYATHLNQCFKPYWVMSKKNQHYNYGIIGSSRALDNINIKITELYGKKDGINLAASGTGIAECYLLYSEFIENGNTLDTLLMQIDIYSLNASISFNSPFHPYLYFPYLKEKDVQEVYKDNVGKLKLFFWMYVPYFKYAEFNNYFPIYKMTMVDNMCPVSPFEAYDGSEILTDDDYAGFKPVQKKYHTVNLIDKKYIEKLIQLAQKQGTKVIFFTSPELKDIKQYQENREQMYVEIRKIAEKYNIKYHDFTNYKDFTDKSLFGDYLHLNPRGVEKFSEFFADTLLQSN